MPAYARCPHCHAALAPAAPWCSLCLADLRTSEDQLEPASAGRHASGATGVVAPGRHRRVEGVPVARRRAPTERVDELQAEVQALMADAPTTAEGKVDVDVLTDQLIARLSASESSAPVPAVDRVPGGKWGLMIIGMVSLTAVIVAVSIVVGALLFRS